MLQALDIIKVLKNLSETTVARLSSTRAYEQGMQWLHSGVVRGWRWDGVDAKDAALEVQLYTQERAYVRFTMVEGRFKSTCELLCTAKEGLCSHAVCAIMSLVNLYQNEAESRIDELRSFLEPLLQVPWGKEGKEIELRIGMHIDALQGGLHAKWYRKKVEIPQWMNGIDPVLALIPFEDTLTSATPCLFALAAEVVTRVGGRILIIINGKTSVVSWASVSTFLGGVDGVQDLRGQTRLEWRENDEVALCREFVLHDRVVTVDDLHYLGNGFIMDTDSHVLTHVSADVVGGWRVMEVMCRAGRGDRLLRECLHSVDVLRFQKSGYLWNGVGDVTVVHRESLNQCLQVSALARTFSGRFEGISCWRGGVEQPLMCIVPEVVVRCTSNVDRGTVQLAVESVLAGERSSYFNGTMRMMLHSLRDLPMWLQTKARQRLLRAAAFDILTAPKPSLQGTIKKLMHELRASYQSKKRNTAAQLSFVELVESFEALAQVGATLEQQVHFVVGSQHFFCVESQRNPLIPVYQQLDELFPEGEWKGSKDASWVTVLQEDFEERLPRLLERLHSLQASCVLDGQSVELVALDIAIDASQSGGMWFDLAPQIAMHGMPISQELREVIFSGVEVMRTNEGVRLLDPQSREIVAVLTRMFQHMGSERLLTSGREIVQIPRLRILDLLELRQSGARVTLSSADEEMLYRLTHLDALSVSALPMRFFGQLREYQKAGYQWLIELYTYGFGACLADDMGLGKTVQAIAFLSGLAEGLFPSRLAQSGAPHLIVVPPTLLFNWQSEIARFCPSLKVVEYRRGMTNAEVCQYDVVITSYDKVRLDIEELQRLQFHVLILDEAQTIKNIHAARTCAMRKLRSVFTICLTGTPLENHIGEFYSIIDIALPGLLPEYRKFMAYVSRSENDILIRKIRPFILRRTKDAILKELPSKVESNIILEMSAKQEKMYATAVAEVKRAVAHAYDVATKAQATIMALTAILRLRQLCISPKLIDATYADTDRKIEQLVTSLQEVVAEGSAAVVFSQFVMCLNIIERALQEAHISYLRIDGSTAMARRKGIVELFQAGGAESAPVLLLSLKTGGVGLNLTRANYVFHVDPWWNPAVESQASDRVHRIGQQKTVFVTRLVMRHTIEERIMKLKLEKEQLCKQVLEHAENKGTTTALSRSDFEFLLN